MASEQIEEAQDKLLAWEGWQAALREQAATELYPGDGQFTSIPDRDGTDAEQFRKQFDAVFSETDTPDTLYVLVTFKYRDPSMAKDVVSVTEHCVWFQGNPVQHWCGRRRSFLEKIPS